MHVNLFDLKYGCWLVNNDSHRFVFDRESRMFSEIRSGRVLGKYTFEEFDQLTKERGMVGEFSPYEFNINKQKTKRPWDAVRIALQAQFFSK